jgi:hypothetical protein
VAAANTKTGDWLTGRYSTAESGEVRVRKPPGKSNSTPPASVIWLVTYSLSGCDIGSTRRSRRASTSFRNTCRPGAGEIRSTVARQFSSSATNSGPRGTAASAFVSSNNHATLTITPPGFSPSHRSRYCLTGLLLRLTIRPLPTIRQYCTATTGLASSLHCRGWAGPRTPLLGATALVAPVFQADITLTQDLPTVQASVTIVVRGSWSGGCREGAGKWLSR